MGIGSGDARIAETAARVRRTLLERLERMVGDMPEGAVTEQKTQADGATNLFKLRDLTAAYKDLAGDASKAEEDMEDISEVEGMTE